MNRRKALINSVALKFSTISKCIARVVMQVVKQTHFLHSFVSELVTQNGPARSMPTCEKGRDGTVRAFGNVGELG